MAEIHKLILLELERNRFCFAAAIKCAELDGGGKLTFATYEPADQLRRTGGLLDLQACAFAAGLEAIRAQLRRARRAADVVASARLELTDRGSLARAATEASEALTFVAAAVTTPGRQLLVAEAAEALSVVIQLARAVSQHHYHHCQAATDVYRRAAAAGDPVTAAQAAIRVQEASSLAIWAARLGCGPSSRLEEEAIGSPPDASLQAAFEPAAQLAETALSGSPPDIGDLSCFVAIADVGRQFKLEQLQKRPRLST